MLSERHKDMIALTMAEGIGPKSLMDLLGKVSDPRELFAMTPGEISKLARQGAWRNVDFRPVKGSGRYAGEIEYVERNDIKVISCRDAAYPGSLLNIYDPPPVLYCRGELKKADNDAVAIVGSRKCSIYGRRMAEKLASDLAERGVTIVSGMARGIDEAAHRGAIRAGGRTIAVLGSGFKEIYPRGSEDLAELIFRNGALITEFPSDVMPQKGNFPRRNRIISGLSLGVVVVEAAKKSGSLITADFALDQGKEVFAVPGMADAATSAGTNTLIRSGARLVTCARDILEELGMDPDGEAPDRDMNAFQDNGSLTAEEKRVLEALEEDISKCVDEISGATGMAPVVLADILLKLEISGRVVTMPGRRYLGRGK